MTGESLAGLLGRCLAAVGVRTVYVSGDEVAGLEPHVEVVPVASPALAALLADADGRLGPRPGAALLPGNVVRLSSRPGGGVEPLVVDDASALAEAVAGAGALATAGVPATAALVVDLDLASPAPPKAVPLHVAPPDAPDPAARLPATVDGAVVVLAGPGVVREEAVDALQALAARGGLGVANTWGAKGVFRWDSPHHMGTVGLQARDFELLGIADAALVLATGVDKDEAPPACWALAPVVGAAPRRLPDLAAGWPWPAAPTPPPNELYRSLAAVVQPLYRSETSPLSPGRAVFDVSSSLPPEGLVFADPGPAGLWVARAFPTTRAGSVLVPATRAPGFAAAAAFVAARRGAGRPVAITTGPPEEATEAVFDLARAHGAAFVLACWGDDGIDDPATHATAVAEALRRPATGVERIDVAVDFGATALLVDVAGEVVAWS